MHSETWSHARLRRLGCLECILRRLSPLGHVDAFYRREGLLSDEDNTWWLREGGGSTLVDVGDDEIDKAVFRFLIEHRELFSRLWYGVITKDPNDDPEITIYLQEQEPAGDGDAA